VYQSFTEGKNSGIMRIVSDESPFRRLDDRFDMIQNRALGSTMRMDE